MGNKIKKHIGMTHREKRGYTGSGNLGTGNEKFAPKSETKTQAAQKATKTETSKNEQKKPDNNAFLLTI